MCLWWTSGLGHRSTKDSEGGLMSHVILFQYVYRHAAEVLACPFSSPDVSLVMHPLDVQKSYPCNLFFLLYFKRPKVFWLHIVILQKNRQVALMLPPASFWNLQKIRAVSSKTRAEKRREDGAEIRCHPSLHNHSYLERPAEMCIHSMTHCQYSFHCDQHKLLM